MPSHPETNPHFIETPLQQPEDQHYPTPSIPGVSQPRIQDQGNAPSGTHLTQLPNRGQGSNPGVTRQPQGQDQENQPRGARVIQPQSRGKSSKQKTPQEPQRPNEGYFSAWAPPIPRQDQPAEDHYPLHGLHFQSPWVAPPRKDKDREPSGLATRPQSQDQDGGPSRVTQPKLQSADHGPPAPVTKPRHRDEEHVPLAPVTQPRHKDEEHGIGKGTPPERHDRRPWDRPHPVPGITPTQPEHGISKGTPPEHQERRPWDRPQPTPGITPTQPYDHRARRHGFRPPNLGKTTPLTWLAGVFCAIFWIVVFLGGLIVLIVYLVYRPRSPRFDISSATLNAAYIDSGSLLNADLQVLANFTNLNKKMRVDFSYMIIDLYYRKTLISTQYIEPFSAGKMESRFVYTRMTTSQVWIPLKDGQRLQEQMERNSVILEVKGVFRVRSKLGGLLPYTYKLYGHCTILVTAPPNGVLLNKSCRTKR